MKNETVIGIIGKTHGVNNAANPEKKAIIKKHRSLPEKELSFEIINEGIRKKGWL